MTEFKASWDKVAKGITIFVTTLFAFIIYSIFSSDGSKIGSYIVSALILLIYFGTYAFRPLKYWASETSLIIKRPWSDVVVEKSHIRSIENIDSRNIRFAVRTFGVGGLFGYFGLFYDSVAGTMTWYVTRQDKCVMVTTDKGKKIVISPDEPYKLIAALQ